MKHFVGFFLPLCIFSFIAFGISVAVLGIESTASSSAVTLRSETTVLREEYSRIEVTSNFGDMHIYPNDDNSTIVMTDKDMLDDVSVYVKDKTLHIYCGSINTNDFKFSDLLDGMFTFSNSDVTVYVPQKIYDSIYATNNAGSTEILDIGAMIAELKVNAGDLIYSQPEEHRSEKLSVKTNAGSATVYNADTYNYELALGAGDMYVYGLTGSGKVDVSAGDCELNYAELNGNITTDVSAGDLDINLPKDISAEIICDKSAGDVEVDYYDTEADMDDGESLSINGNDYRITAKVSAGEINITNEVEYMLPDLPSIPPVIDSTTTVMATTSVGIVPQPEEDGLGVHVGDDGVDIDLGVIGVDVDDEHVDVNVGPIGVDVGSDKVKVEIGNLKVDIG